MLSKQQKGAAGEAAAREHLIKLGYYFVAQNARNRYGEIDLVMRDGSTVVFVEVKARKSAALGRPEEAVTSEKLRHTIAAAHEFMRSQRYAGPWRIDVVAILPNEVRHIPNVTALN